MKSYVKKASDVGEHIQWQNVVRTHHRICSICMIYVRAVLRHKYRMAFTISIYVDFYH